MPLAEVALAAGAAFVLSFLLVPLAGKIAKAKSIIGQPGGRHRHSGNVPLLGGVGVFVAVLLTWVLHPTLVLTPDSLVLIIGLLVIVLLGIADDIWELSWPQLLLGQALAALTLLFGAVSLTSLNIFGGLRLDTLTFMIPEGLCLASACVLPVLGSLLLLVWVVAVVNSMNWLDGADGVAASVGAVALASLLLLALRPAVFQPPLAILAAAGLGGLWAFLYFNLPPASVFLGSAGSFGTGYLIAALAVLAGAKLATVGTVLLLPLADMAAVVLKRLRAGHSVVRGDNRHLHYALASRGIQPVKLVLLYLGAASIFGLAAVLLPHPTKAIVLVAGFLALTYLLVILDNEDKENA